MNVCHLREFSFETDQVRFFFLKISFTHKERLSLKYKTSFSNKPEKGVIAMIKITECCIPKDKEHTVNLVWLSVSLSLSGAMEVQGNVIIKTLLLFSSTAILSWWQSGLILSISKMRNCAMGGKSHQNFALFFFSLNMHFTVVSSFLEIKFCWGKKKVPCSHTGK